MINRLIFFILISNPLLFSIEKQIAVQQDNHPLTVGQATGFRFAIQAPAFIDNIVIAFSHSDLEVLKKETTHRQLSASIEIWEIKYQIAFFNTGKIPVGPFEIKFFQQGKLVDSEQVKRLYFQVNSLLKAEETLHDIKPPLNLEVDPARKRLFLIRGGLVLASLLLIIVLILLLKKLKNLKRELTPAQALWQKLDQLYKKSTVDQANLRQIFFEISTLLKEYLNCCWQLPAEHLTNRELLYFLPKSAIHSGLIEHIKKFFRFSEQVKYARNMPAKKEIILQLKTIEKLLNEMHHDLFSATR